MWRRTIVTLVVLTSLGVPTTPAGTAEPHQANEDAGTPCPSVRARVVRDVPYVGDPASDRQRLDVFVPERTEACDLRPIVVWVHGGGWATGDKRGTAETKAALFNGLGYVFVSVNYRLSSPVGAPDRPMHPAHADDVGAAVAWLGADAGRFGGDGRRIALLGHSAGAHLVALVGTDPTFVERSGGKVGRIRCVGSYDTASYDLVQRSGETRLVENAFGADETTLRAASPATHIGDRERPPLFQIAVRGAPSRRATQTTFTEAAEAAGIDVTVIEAFGLSHAEVNRLIGAPGDTRMTPAVTAFVTDCLGPGS